MSAIQELTPFLDQFTKRVRQAKEEQQITIDRIVEQSGVSVSTVTKIVSGAQTDPKLSVAASVCQALNLSLDEVTGIVPAPTASSEPPDEALLARVRDLELENAKKDGIIEEKDTRLKAIHPLVYGLCALCVTLAMALAAYLLGDSQYPEIGLIRWGEITGPAWILIGIIAASVIVTVLLVWQVTHPRRHKNG